MMVLVPKQKESLEFNCGNCGEPCGLDDSELCEGRCGRVFCPVCAGLRTLCDDCQARLDRGHLPERNHND